MSKTLTFRIDDALFENLSDVSSEMDRDKTYIIKKAIEKYIDEYSDYQIALGRLKDKDDKIISMSEMEQKLED
jgi:RHH-type rel operon transcriptional repressor/antitoxin RelB